MTTKRSFTTLSLNIQFDNPHQPPQWGAPALLTQVVMVTDAAGNPVYPPAHQMLPAVAEDITDDFLAALQERFASLGLVVDRAE